MTFDVHLGSELEKKVREVGMTKAEFARRMNVERQTVNAWWHRDTFDVKLLVKAGRILGVDFLALFRDPEEKIGEASKSRCYLMVEVPVQDRDELIRRIR